MLQSKRASSQFRTRFVIVGLRHRQMLGALRHAHLADRPTPACAIMMHGQCTSPKIYPTAAMVFDESDMESLDRISADHLQAAQTATLRQRVMEQNAALNDMSVEQFMCATDSMPCRYFKYTYPQEDAFDETLASRNQDRIEQDYMQAVRTATATLNSLEAKAASAGQTVDEYMCKHGLLTDTHLAPWAR
jgi:hypothetical protein